MLIDKKEVLRYLGYKGNRAEHETLQKIDDCIKICKEYAVPKYIYKTFSVTNDFCIENSRFSFDGEDIKKHLSGAGQVVLLAATLGAEIERKIRLYSLTDLSLGLVLDACASAYIESVCSCAEYEISRKISGEGKGITKRYSPGYGDFPLAVQRDIINLLYADKRIGLSATSSHILIPRKSVTAVIGIVSDMAKNIKPHCEGCRDRERCRYKKHE